MLQSQYIRDVNTIIALIYSRKSLVIHVLSSKIIKLRVIYTRYSIIISSSLYRIGDTNVTICVSTVIIHNLFKIQTAYHSCTNNQQ